MAGLTGRRPANWISRAIFSRFVFSLMLSDKGWGSSGRRRARFSCHPEPERHWGLRM